MMDLQTRKLELIQEFLNIQSEDVISRLEKILNKENKKLRHEDFKPMTIDEFNSRIDQSMEDSKNDRLIDASELEAKIDKWN
jgi:chemotaxis protein CheY-P-specific phosphatase CheC